MRRVFDLHHPPWVKWAYLHSIIDNRQVLSRAEICLILHSSTQPNCSLSAHLIFIFWFDIRLFIKSWCVNLMFFFCMMFIYSWDIHYVDPSTHQTRLVVKWPSPSPKKILFQKNLVQKHFWSKIFLVQKNFGSKDILGQIESVQTTTLRIVLLIIWLPHGLSQLSPNPAV